MYFEYYGDASIQWGWRLQAANNRIIAYGEAYYNKDDCLSAIRLVKGSKDAPVKEVES